MLLLKSPVVCKNIPPVRQVCISFTSVASMLYVVIKLWITTAFKQFIGIVIWGIRDPFVNFRASHLAVYILIVVILTVLLLQTLLIGYKTAISQHVLQPNMYCNQIRHDLYDQLIGSTNLVSLAQLTRYHNQDHHVDHNLNSDTVHLKY